jgi:hypothetical protein
MQLVETGSLIRQLADTEVVLRRPVSSIRAIATRLARIRMPWLAVTTDP